MMSGTLKKKDDMMSGLWVEHFFVLDPGSRRLAYYAKEPVTLTAGGGSEYRFCDYENIEERGGSSRKFRLDIHVDQGGKEKVIAVAAKTQQDKIAWIQALASSDEMEFICPQCYKAFKKQQDLVGHFEEHQAEANALLLESRGAAQSPEGADVERQFEPIQILDNYVGAPELEMRSAQLMSEMVMESEMIKEMVKMSKTREDLLDMNHHFAHMLGKLPLPTSDLEGLTLKQANKDASRERFIVNGRLVEGGDFFKELLEKVAPLDTGTHSTVLILYSLYCTHTTVLILYSLYCTNQASYLRRNMSSPLRLSPPHPSPPLSSSSISHPHTLDTLLC
jgi:hypothetical protein